MALISEIKQIRGTRRELRRFGVVMALGLLFIGALLHWRQNELYVAGYILAAVFLLAAIAWPEGLWPIHKSWMTLALVIGWVTTRVILAALFFLVMTPIGVAGRLFGKDFLDEKIDRSAVSYWRQRERKAREPRDYEQQF